MVCVGYNAEHYSMHYGHCAKLKCVSEVFHPYNRVFVLQMKPYKETCSRIHPEIINSQTKAVVCQLTQKYSRRIFRHVSPFVHKKITSNIYPDDHLEINCSAKMGVNSQPLRIRNLLALTSST